MLKRSYSRKAFQKRRNSLETKEYERLASAYLDTIYRVAVNGCKNHADAEDVVQNTFMKLLEKENRFEDDNHARKWLIRVAVNECNSLWRSPWKRHTTSLDELGQETIYHRNDNFK